jgi:PhnB protein
MASFQREGWGTVTPRIVTPDAAGLVQFLRAVFDARGECPAGAPAEMRIGDSVIMISEGGDRREAMPAFLYIYVADADRSYARAIGLGAVPIEAPRDTPYGDRRAMIRDSWGNLWQIATCKGGMADP